MTQVNTLRDAHERLAKAKDASTVAANRLRGGVAALTSQMTGVPPVVSSLTSVLGSFAFGSPYMVALLFGIAAIGFAWNKLTEDARKVKEAADKAVESIQKMNRLRALGAGAELKMQTADINREINRQLGVADFARTHPQVGGMAEVLATAMAEIARLRGVRNSVAGDIVRAEADAENAAQSAWRKGLTDQIEKNKAALEKMNAAEKAAFEKREQQLKVHIAELNRLSGGDFGAGAVFAIAQRLIGKVIGGGRDAFGNNVRAGSEADDDRIRAQYDAARKRVDDATKDAEKAREAAKRYAEDMRQIWRDGISRIITDGTKSFRDFFEDVLQMFSRLMSRMAAESSIGNDKTKSMLYKGLGLGSSAIGGAFTGYQIGQQSGSAGLGGIGGALSGAAFGQQILPGIGAVVGGLAGLAGGLLGGAKAAREHAESLLAAQKAIRATIADLHDLATGSENSLESRIRHAHEAFDRARTDATSTFRGTGAGQWFKGRGPDAADKFKADMDQIKADEAAYIELLKKEQAIKNQHFREDLDVRYLRATGHAKDADALAFKQQQDRERQALIDSFGSEIDAIEAETLARLNAVLAAEKLRQSFDALTTSLLNVPAGYKYQSRIFEAMTARPFGIGVDALPTPYSPLGGPTGTGQMTDVLTGRISGGPKVLDALKGVVIENHITIDDLKITLPDGTVLTSVVLKNLKARAQRQFGDSSAWSDVQ